MTPEGDKRIIVRFDGGGEATIVSLTGDDVILRSTAPFAPGQPAEGALETGERVRVKAHGSKKIEGGFEVRARFLDLRRELRERLARLVG